MKHIMVLICSVLLAGCAANSPSWITSQTEDNVRYIKWNKNLFGAPTANGVICNVFSEDREDRLQILGKQIKACFNGDLPKNDTVVASTQNHKRIVWHRVVRDDVANKYIQLYGFPRPGTEIKGMLGSMAGFYFYKDDICHVVVPDDLDFLYEIGHEVKHCFDGNFHRSNGEWIKS